MSETCEAILLAIAACGTAALLFILHSALLRPPKSAKGLELYGVIRVRGNAPALEHSVKWLRWLRSGGADMRIVIADDGMDGETRASAELLIGHDGDAVLCGINEIDKLIGGSGSE